MNLAHKRAHHALGAVQHLRRTHPTGDDKVLKSYVSSIKALPANVLRNGLGQAIAMERMGVTRGGATGGGHCLLCGHMEQWLFTSEGSRLFRGAWQGNPTPTSLIEAIVHERTTQDDYLRAQSEALAYLEWLKKFAVAFLSPPPKSNEEARAEESGETS